MAHSLSEKIKHEVWSDQDGLTGVCLADERGNAFRELHKSGGKLIHVFCAENHYEAMTIYYRFMNWGQYETQFEVDKKPYDKI